MAEASLYQLTTKEIARGYSTIRIPLSRLSLPLILFSQAAISLLLLRNSAFQDEALYLLAGRDILSDWLGLPHFPLEWASFLSGYPYFYPVIGGALDMLGGVELARMFSMLCMLGVTASVYYVTKRIFDQSSAILAAILFAFQGPVLFLSRLATYDSLCLLLIALAVVVAIHVSTTRAYWLTASIGPLVVLAILAKYAGLLFMPIPFAILILRCHERNGWRNMFLQLAIALCSLAIAAVVAYIILDKAALHAISGSTTNRDVIVKNSALYLIQFILTLSGIGFALGFLGLVLGGRRRLLTGLLLFASSLLVPAYHVYEGELISLHKHLAFSMFFVLPLAGYAIARIAGLQDKPLVATRVNKSLDQAERTGRAGTHPGLPIGPYWMAAVAICLITFSLGIQQAQNLYGQWANSNVLITAMQTQVRLGSGRYLVEDFDVCRYYLQDDTDLWQWSGLDFFVYTDKEHHYLQGRDAYRAAIQEGYFVLVELSYGYDAPTAIFISQQLIATKQYALIARIPLSNSFGRGYYWLWRKL